jgi:NTP pyrophosphatase (non-canonical NTP hydrolase)
MPFREDDNDGPMPAAPEVHTIPVKIAETSDHQKPESEPATSKAPSPAEAKLRKIQSEVEELLQRVEKFQGSKKDKEYLYLDDLLTQKLCLLDGIDSEGRDDIRKLRKDSIKTINRCLSMLDRHATPQRDAEDVVNKFLSDLAGVSVAEEGKNDARTEEKK